MFWYAERLCSTSTLVIDTYLNFGKIAVLNSCNGSNLRKKLRFDAALIVYAAASESINAIFFIWLHLEQKNLFNSPCTSLAIILLFAFDNSFELTKNPSVTTSSFKSLHQSLFYHLKSGLP